MTPFHLPSMRSRVASTAQPGRRVKLRLFMLVPTFRSSCSAAAPTFTNFAKSWALENLLILVPLCRSEVPDRTRRLWSRDFRSAVLGFPIVYKRGLYPLIYSTCQGCAGKTIKRQPSTGAHEHESRRIQEVPSHRCCRGLDRF